MKNKYCNPKLIKAELDSYVMGQEKGTKAIAMAIAQHLLQIEARKYCSEENIPTDNALLIGPTGCGKTETFRVLKKLEREIECPVLMFNTLDYSGTGTWRNTAPLSKIFGDVFMHAANIYYAKFGDAADADTQKSNITKIANNAIILLDEFDKIAMMGEENALLFLKEYQSALLKMIEGNTYTVQDFTHTRVDKEGNEEELDISDNKVDTTNMMFIFLGAFSGIETLTRNRLRRERMVKMPDKEQTKLEHPYRDTHIGFLARPKQEEMPEPLEPEAYTYEQLIPSQEDVVHYGFMRELIGRIPIRTVYMPLSEDALVDILLRCKTSAYREYQRRFRQVGLDLKADRDALREIAKIAIKQGTGARGLRSVFEELLTETRFELAGTDRFIRCLLRGREIREGKLPICHDRTKLMVKRRRQLLKRYKAFRGKRPPKVTT